MAVEVETMFYTCEQTWHGLGVQVKDIPALERLHGLWGLAEEYSRKPESYNYNE